MAEPDTMLQIVRDYHRGVTRRTEAALRIVGEAIYAWMLDNLTGPLRADWRESLHRVWAEQSARGRTVVPESTVAFEAAVERYSELCAQSGKYLPPPNPFPWSVPPPPWSTDNATAANPETPAGLHRIVQRASDTTSPSPAIATASVDTTPTAWPRPPRPHGPRVSCRWVSPRAAGCGTPSRPTRHCGTPTSPFPTDG